MNGSVLITGAAGYIGSHVIEALILNETALSNRALIFLDDLSTGHREFIDYLTKLAEKNKWKKPEFEKISLTDSKAVEAVFQKHKPELVLHFAAKISVAESVANPDLYHRNNVEGSIQLLSAMKNSGTKKIVFSSTAAVYGAPKDSSAIKESAALAPVNPYGKNKLDMENSIRAAHADFGLQSIIFRYFNACGASASGSLGEWHEPETHLIPLVLKAAIQKKPIQVFGNDYDTSDGSCVRDYIHVNDLASAHLLATKRLLSGSSKPNEIFNLGTSTGTSVLEVIQAAESVLGQKMERQMKPRRAGDSAVLVADSSHAQAILGWKTHHSNIKNILETALKWERKSH